jgi:site-specific recombinase XerD
VPWVFPGERLDGYFTGLPKVWKQVRQAAELPGVRLHDLRHGFASAAVANGASLYLVGKVLGHTQAATTSHYAHLSIDPVRALADQTSRHLAGAMAPKSTGANVVSMPQRTK